VFRELLLQRTAEFCRLSAIQLGQLQKHYELMMRWNKTVNLTRIEDLAEAIDRHYSESLFLGSKLPPGPLTIADVGSGAGFPGVPIAILRPEVSVVLIESHQRKAVFLKEVTRDLPNVRVDSGRAECLVGTFDWVVSRAVSWPDLETLRLAPKLALIGTEAPGLVIPIPGEGNRKVVIVSRGTGCYSRNS